MPNPGTLNGELSFRDQESLMPMVQKLAFMAFQTGIFQLILAYAIINISFWNFFPIEKCFSRLATALDFISIDRVTVPKCCYFSQSESGT